MSLSPDAAATESAAPAVEASAPGRMPAVVIAMAIFVLALNLRMGISSVGPVLPDVLRGLGASVVFGSLLTTAPVVMMGLASPLSARLATRVGIEWTIVLALVTVTLATALRLVAVAPWILLLSALVLGTGIAAGNTMLPAVVRSYFPLRTALMTGIYSVGINAGAGSAALLTPRIAVGGQQGWRGALAVWALVSLPATVVWLAIAARAPRVVRRVTGAMARHTRQAWLAALVFGLQSMVYYGIIAWLAPLYEEHGWSKSQAGLLVSFFTATQIVGAMSAPLLVQRTGRLALGLRVTGVLLGAGLLLVGLVPEQSPWLWTAILGLGAGGIFPLSLIVPLAVTTTVDDARRVTALMLCYGYLLGATGPFAVSVLRSVSGGFALGFAFLAVLCAGTFTLAGSVSHPGRRPAEAAASTQSR